MPGLRCQSCSSLRLLVYNRRHFVFEAKVAHNEIETAADNESDGTSFSKIKNHSQIDIKSQNVVHNLINDFMYIISSAEYILKIHFCRIFYTNITVFCRRA